MKNNIEKQLIRWTYISNIANIACFTILAIAFRHWWIVFFSLLFINTIELKTSKKENEN